MQLKDIVGSITIVAHNEDTSTLEASLAEFGLQVDVQRLSYTEEELALPAIYRCLLNHNQAWKNAAKKDGYSLICEADFIPISGIASYPIDWLPESEVAWAHLYTCSPRIIKPFDGFLRVHQATMVCYLINGRVAAALSEFVAHYDEHFGAESLAPWDTFIQWYAMGQAAELYIPLKSLGEHGGLPNPEHAMSGMRHIGVHRADALAGKLAFSPVELGNNQYLYILQRLYFRVAAFARVLLGKWINPVPEFKWNNREKLRAIYMGITRLF